MDLMSVSNDTTSHQQKFDMDSYLDNCLKVLII